MDNKVVARISLFRRKMQLKTRPHQVHGANLGTAAKYTWKAHGTIDAFLFIVSAQWERRVRPYDAALNESTTLADCSSGAYNRKSIKTLTM